MQEQADLQPNASIVKRDDHTIAVMGDLDFKTVVSLLKKSLSLFPDLSRINIDLSEVESTNSAGLALLIEWVKYAKKHKRKILFKNIPKQLIAIADVCAVTEFLNID